MASSGPHSSKRRTCARGASGSRGPRGQQTSIGISTQRGAGAAGSLPGEVAVLRVPVARVTGATGATDANLIGGAPALQIAHPEGLPGRRHVRHGVLLDGPTTCGQT